MSVLEAIILGIVQGIGEFLPISSSGHLLLLQRFFGIEENLLTFNVVVHVGTLIPVIYIYFARIKDLVKNPFQKLTWLLVIGTLPAVFAALFLGDVVDRLFSGDYLAVGFLVTALLLIIIDMKPVKGSKSIREMSYLDAVVIGLIQMVAITPGISRSGSTIFGGTMRGLDKRAAADFSFLLAIPAIAGATVLEIFDIIRGGGASVSYFFTYPVILGFIVSILVGYLCIKLLLKLIVGRGLKPFAYYLMVLSVLILADQIFIRNVL